MEEILSSIYQQGASFGLKVLYALVVLVVGVKVIGWALKKIKHTPAYTRMDAGLQSFVHSGLRILLYILLALVIIGVLDLPTTGFVTMLASGGVAIGLALQGALSNFAGGLMLLFFKPFKVGDVVETGGYTGTVTGVTVFYTILLTPDNKQITLPNGALTNAALVNYSAQELRRVDMTFNTAYNCDIEQVKEIILGAANDHELVLKDEEKAPLPFVRLSAQMDSSLQYTLRVWCAGADYWTVFFDLNEEVKKRFDANDIEIPFPQLDIRTR